VDYCIRLDSLKYFQIEVTLTSLFTITVSAASVMHLPDMNSNIN